MKLMPAAGHTMAVKFRKTKDADGCGANSRSSVDASVQDGDFREVR